MAQSCVKPLIQTWRYAWRSAPFRRRSREGPTVSASRIDGAEPQFALPSEYRSRRCSLNFSIRRDGLYPFGQRHQFGLQIRTYCRSQPRRRFAFLKWRRLQFPMKTAPLWRGDEQPPSAVPQFGAGRMILSSRGAGRISPYQVYVFRSTCSAMKAIGQFRNSRRRPLVRSVLPDGSLTCATAPRIAFGSLSGDLRCDFSDRSRL